MFGPLMAALSRLMGTRVGHWFLSALGFLGLNFVAQEFAVEPLLNGIKGAIAGAPGEVVAWISYMNVDKYFTLILSAYATAAAAGALKMRAKKK